MNSTLDTTLGGAVQVLSNFTRSVHVERDADLWLNGTSHYIFTPLAREVLARVLDGVLSPRAARAWSITGPYGGGKSAFTLALVQLLGPGDVVPPLLSKLAEQDPNLAEALMTLRQEGKRLLPVVVSGQRHQLTPAVLQGLITALAPLKNQSKAKRRLYTRACETDPLDARTVTSLFEETALVFGGAMLIVDELGKFLEYLGQRPDQADVFVLQLLAEAAARSTSSPLLVFTVLHQAATLYGGNLTRGQRDELSKVQGRFEDIAFQPPVDQMLSLIDAAIAFTDERTAAMYRAEAVQRASQVWTLNLAPSTLSEVEAQQLLGGCAPLHPVTALLLGPLFRRLAQHERSLFAFLSSSEPFGFQEFLQTSTGSPSFYTPDQLYDYVVGTFGASLYQHPTDGRRWAQVETTLDRLRSADPLDIRLLKTIGLLAAIGELGEIRPNVGVLSCALDVPEETAAVTLDKLTSQSLLVYRRFLGAYRLWDGSDVDIEAQLVRARAQIDLAQPLADLLTRHLKPRPIVAKKYSYEQGSLRFFQVMFCAADELAKTVMEARNAGLAGADGLLLYTLAESAVQTEELRQIACAAPYCGWDDVIIVPVHIPAGLKDGMVELQALRWVQQNTAELREDAVARRELRSRLYETERFVLRQLDLVLSPPDQLMHVFYGGKQHRIGSQRELNAFISSACTRIYTNAPAIKNELINRRNVSSAAAAARRTLLQRMIEHGDEPRLGMEGSPPELSIYRSLLSTETTGIHRSVGGQWGFGRPLNPTFDAVWATWEAFLTSSASARRNISELWSLLASRPLGIMNGIIPIVLCAMLLERHLDVALYEVGTFLPELTTAAMERLIKNPDRFQLRYCPLDGMRQDVFSELTAVGIGSADSHQVLAVVGPLCRWARQLAPYTQKTGGLSSSAKEVRRVLLDAHEPDVLLFEQLPLALGLPAVSVGSESDPNQAKLFAQRLRDIIRELNMAYRNLLDRLGAALLKALDLPDKLSDARRELHDRVQILSELTSDFRMKAFVQRLADDALDDHAWLEAMGTLLASRPPQTWVEGDVRRFETELAQLSIRFKNLQELAIAMGRSPDHMAEGERAIRVGLTVAGEADYQKVIFIKKQQQALAARVANNVLSELEKNRLDREGRLAVLVQLLERELQQ